MVLKKWKDCCMAKIDLDFCEVLSDDLDIQKPEKKISEVAFEDPERGPWIYLV
jgi:hypothetical protein